VSRKRAIELRVADTLCGQAINALEREKPDETYERQE